ncbi:tRNA pseudouridine synthase A [Melitaea cinxia]|uniref:tRNA pseudouridine synthase A n=1 Tax=Melitaea cinxia TaxID=113334 RepID=UPI001E2741FE|nr:tRNA pseudouridine synthase A [Melitaea cinxia]
MSVRFLQLFVSSLRQNLPRPSNIVRSGRQLRFTSIMSATEQLETKNDDLVQNKNHTRYKKRFLKRQWESGGKKSEDGESDEKKVCDKPFERIKRKKMAMLLGYCGVDYYGMQRNPGVPTIEEELLKALYDAKYITEDDFKNQQNAHFQRSSRTDKGVSAARQVVSLKLPLEVNIDEINSRLPPCIKVFTIKRATNKFNSKSKCNARTYSYTLPTYVFEPSLSTEQERKTYRISAEKMTKVNEVLAFYKGTKSYHNFTEKKHYQDPSSLRYMMSFKLERLFHECEMEFAELLVKGQSFMLHQIRKMVGLMIIVVRGQTDIGMLEKAFGKEKVIIPTAPGLGLVLDKVHYERYDAKFKDSHESLSWDEEDEAVERFKREQIFPNIVKGEIEENSMGLWLEKVKGHSFEPSDEVIEDKNEITGADDDDDDENEMVIDTSKVEASDTEATIEVKGIENNDVVETKDVVDEGDKTNVKDTCEIKGDENNDVVGTKDVVNNGNESNVKDTCEIKGDEIKSTNSAV